MAYASTPKAVQTTRSGRLSDWSGQPDRGVHSIVQIRDPSVKSISIYEVESGSSTAFNLGACVGPPVGLGARQLDLELSPDPT